MQNKIDSLIIYGDDQSQPSRSLIAFCKINKIPYQFKLVDLAKDEQKKRGL